MLKGPAWMDKRESKHKKDLLSHLKKGGAVIHRQSGEIFCSPREYPADLRSSPYSYRKCTADDLMREEMVSNDERA